MTNNDKKIKTHELNKKLKTNNMLRWQLSMCSETKKQTNKSTTLFQTQYDNPRKKNSQPDAGVTKRKKNPG